MKAKISAHYAYDRRDRENLIKEIGYGKKVEEFIEDRGHPNGPEIHVISTTGIISIFNLRTNKLITKIIATPGQTRRYYENRGRAAPEDLLRIAYENKKRNPYNI